MTRRSPRIPALLLLVAGAAPSCAVIDIAHVPTETLIEAPVEIPLEFEKRRAWVEVTIEGQGPYRFLIDTGSAALVIDREVAAELELGGLPMPLFVRGADRAQWRWVRQAGVDELEIGDARFHDVGCTILDLPEGEDGILSFGLFADCLPTIDFPERRLVLRPRTGPVEIGPDAVPYELDRGIPVVEVPVGDEVVRATLDTGYNGWLQLPDALEPWFEFRVPPNFRVEYESIHGSGEFRGGQLDGILWFGDTRVLDPIVTLGGDGALLGTGVLQYFVVHFDPHARTIWLERDGAGTIQPAFLSR